MLARLGAAYDQFPAKEFLVVQFGYRTLGFVDRLHLDECETFRALVVPIAHDLSVLHVANAIKQLEEIALSGVEGKVADVETR